MATHMQTTSQEHIAQLLRVVVRLSREVQNNSVDLGSANGRIDALNGFTIQTVRRIAAMNSSLNEQLDITRQSISDLHNATLEWPIKNMSAKIASLAVDTVKAFNSKPFHVNTIVDGAVKLRLRVGLTKSAAGEIKLGAFVFNLSERNFNVEGWRLTLCKSHGMNPDNTFHQGTVVERGRGRGWPDFVNDVRPYIVNDEIKIKLDKSAHVFLLEEA